MDLRGVEEVLKPWYTSLSDPGEAQYRVLATLLEGYSKTEYGKRFDAGDIQGLEEFRESFPITNYQGFLPYIEKVMEGDYRALLPEPPIEWAMTRGSTGKSKLIPLTRTDIGQRILCGGRALLNYARRTGDYSFLEGCCLNLNFPSRVGSLRVGGKAFTYGYSSGIYAKYNAREHRVRLIPEQEEIDGLGADLSREGWERRFQLAYERARDADITMCIGVVSVMVSFASYLKRRYGVYPKDLWNMRFLGCTSMPKIQTKYKPILERMYGDIDVVEIYGATEGIYAQQLDEKPYISPNYDIYLFEVYRGGRTKMLHEMRPGEWGRIIVSSTLFPRYDIGDLIECYGKGYFRVFGRAKPQVILEHVAYKIGQTLLNIF